MITIDNAVRVIKESRGYRSAFPLGAPEDALELHARLIAKSLADAGLLTPENMGTEWYIKCPTGVVGLGEEGETQARDLEKQGEHEVIPVQRMVRAWVGWGHLQ